MSGRTTRYRPTRGTWFLVFLLLSTLDFQFKKKKKKDFYNFYNLDPPQGVSELSRTVFAHIC